MQNTVEGKEQVQVSFRVPRVLRDLIQKYIQCDLHLNQSEFFRDALREKIQRDAPQLYNELFQEPKEASANE